MNLGGVISYRNRFYKQRLSSSKRGRLLVPEMMVLMTTTLGLVIKSYIGIYAGYLYAGTINEDCTV